MFVVCLEPRIKMQVHSLTQHTYFSRNVRMHSRKYANHQSPTSTSSGCNGSKGATVQASRYGAAKDLAPQNSRCPGRRPRLEEPKSIDESKPGARQNRAAFMFTGVQGCGEAPKVPGVQRPRQRAATFVLSRTQAIPSACVHTGAGSQPRLGGDWQTMVKAKDRIRYT